MVEPYFHRLHILYFQYRYQDIDHGLNEPVIEANEQQHEEKLEHDDSGSAVEGGLAELDLAHDPFAHYQVSL